MDGKALVAILILAAAAAAPTPARGDGEGIDALARELAIKARESGLRRLAVSRLEPVSRADGRADEETERLTLALVRAGRVQTVERALIGKLSEEIRLDRTGAVAGASQREAAISPVDGLVVGRYEAGPDGVRVYARVIAVQDGVIVAAGTGVIAPQAADESATPPDGSPAAADEACARVQEDVKPSDDALELKARYWALRLRLGEPSSAAQKNALATLGDDDSRGRYEAALASWIAADVIPPLSPDEVARVKAFDARARDRVQLCAR